MARMNKKINIEYYALLREQSGKNAEEIESNAKNARELYQEIRKKYQFSLDTDLLRIAINDEFTDWETEICEGDRVILIPPVAGG